MANVSPRAWPRSVLTAASLVSAAVLVAILYWAQAVLIPIALAALITFMLSPLVTHLHRWGLPRIPAVILVVLVAATVVGGVGYVVTSQVTQLANEIPSYRDNIKQKFSDLRGFLRGGALERLQETFEDVTRELEKEERREEERQKQNDSDGPGDTELAEEEPVPVEVKPEQGPLGVSNPARLGPVLEALATAGLVVVLVIFMLIQREDLRNRIVSVAGQGSLALTTKALDDAGRRISRYLAMQFVLNATYGLAAGCCLFLIGVPYAVLWGFCAGLLRYIPYVGPWVAALLPISVTLMHYPGWTPALLVAGLFIVLELISNNVMEPWLYGHSVGLSALAVILAAVFWTWLWGPVGLVLSTPMTTCFVVLGRYIPALSLLDRLLGERPALKPYVWLYQRLLARDEDEATEIAEEHLAEHGFEATCDDLLLPTLSLVQRDRSHGHISEEDEGFVFKAVEDVLEDLLERREAQDEEQEAGSGPQDRPNVLVMGFPARDRADELALQMTAQLLDPVHCEFQILSHDALIAENIAQIEERSPACVCLISVPPGDLAQARQICKRLRMRWSNLRIVVGRLGARGLSERSRDVLLAAGADRAVGTLSDLRQALIPIIQFYEQAPAASELSTASGQSVA